MRQIAQRTADEVRLCDRLAKIDEWLITLRETIPTAVWWVRNEDDDRSRHPGFRQDLGPYGGRQAMKQKGFIPPWSRWIALDGR